MCLLDQQPTRRFLLQDPISAPPPPACTTSGGSTPQTAPLFRLSNSPVAGQTEYNDPTRLNNKNRRKAAPSRILCVLGLTSQPSITLHPAAPSAVVSVDPASGKEVTISLKEILDRCKSLVGSNAFYTPTLWLASGHASTIYATLTQFPDDKVEYTRCSIRVPDGGTLALDFTPPITDDDPIDSRPMLVLLHGITGGSGVSYVRDVMKRFTQSEKEGGAGLGWRGCVVSFRGCAGSPITSGRFYHAGYTDDLRCALAFISHLAPKAPLFAAGFSFGGNVLTKYLGEEGEATPLKGGVTVGAPFRCYDCHLFLESSFLGKVYSRQMAKELRGLIGRHKERFSQDARLDWSAIHSNPHQTLFEFDSLVTSVLGGFESAEAYYRGAASDQYASGISVPLLSISASDDPVVSTQAVPFALAQQNSFLAFVTTKHGGHLGFLEGFLRPRRWVGKPMVEFLSELFKAHPEMRTHPLTVPRQREGKKPRIGDGMVIVEGKEEMGFAEVETVWVEN